MPAPAAPPPAAPNPPAAPAATTPPSPPAGQSAPPPAGNLEASEQDAFGDAFSELTELDKGSTAPLPPKKGKEGAPPDPLNGKAAETPPEEPEPKGIVELRTAFKNAKKERAELLNKLALNEAKVKELEAASPGEVKNLQEKLAALEKRREELERQVEFTNFSQSEKFQKEYVEPYQKAWTKAIAEIQQFNLSYENEKGEPVTRKATQDDLLALANAPLDQLDELAEAWFGRASARVIRHVEKIKELADAQTMALDEAKSKAGERLKERSENAKAITTRLSTIFEDTKKSLAQKFPKWFAHDETDKEGNELFDKGLAFNNTVFGTNGNLKPEQKASRLAIIQYKAANHDRLARRLKLAMTELAETRKALDEYEKSGIPGKAGERATASGKSYLEDANAEIETLDKKTL